jgi:histidine triad (HIT) family protein
MFNHEPPNYTCPFCQFIAGRYDEHITEEDIIYQNELVTAKISPKWWVNNPGNVLIIPNKHFENLYDIPDDYLAEVYKVVKKVAIAIRPTYDGAEGTSTRQHNELAGNQAIWHLHVHVFPRYPNDNLYQNHDNKRGMSLLPNALLMPKSSAPGLMHTHKAKGRQQKQLLQNSIPRPLWLRGGTRLSS